MIEKLKDFWSIFNNSKHEFYKEKHEAIVLIKKATHLYSITLEVFEKNKEILKYLDTNIHDYPKFMFHYINDLISLIKYGVDSKTIHVDDRYSNFIYTLENINLKCINSCSCMNKQFKQRNFKGVKEEYVKLIKDLRDYEKRYNMVILDDVYNYD